MVSEEPEIDSFAEYLRAIAPSVPSTLVSSTTFADLEDLARRLPGNLALNTFGFECRIGDERPLADLLVQATSTHGRDALAGAHPTSRLSGALLTDPIWRGVRGLADCWADPAIDLDRTVDNLWLEFDVDGPTRRFPRPERVPRTGRGRLRRSRARSVRRPCRRLPEDRRDEGRVPDRRRGSGTGPGELSDCLVDCTWLDLDMGETVHPKIGLECYFEGHEQPGHEPRWAQFLEALVREACAPRPYGTRCWRTPATSTSTHRT